ncbi:YoaK family protein [Paludibaculum fermentans]|uniref:YoaK family protein n=1 Tax=Paludibaculum fermentans TaxID=1473598 RepID=UPI003EB9C5E2
MTPSTVTQPAKEPAKADELPLLAALLLLTFSTGLIDAVSVLGLGRVFTANMTGNIVFLGFAVAGTPGLSVTRSLASLGMFIAGAIGGGRLAKAMASHSTPQWLVTAVLTEGGFLLAAALAAIGFDASAENHSAVLYAAIALTAVAMGLRNATVRRLGVPDLTTTVLTLTLTGIAADSSLAGGTNLRISRRLASVCLMFTGAALGALLLRFGLAVPLAVSGAVALISAALLSTTSPAR